ncbi:hypothetical protein K502DRAFT_362985 [Neoconidiobolus thromboides FSU 785]|nr:hypothetical protein K502DRAFT_362985 [Neoconidiobolus thromboides FSU 785]
MSASEEIENLKIMFCPPLEMEMIEKVYKNCNSFDEAVNELLCINFDNGLEVDNGEGHEDGENREDETQKTESKDSGINFLKTCFPNEKEETLSKILKENNLDTDLAIESYLSYSYIQQNVGLSEDLSIKIATKDDKLKQVSDGVTYQFINNDDGDNKYTNKNNKKNKKSKKKNFMKEREEININNFEIWNYNEWKELNYKIEVIKDVYREINLFKICEIIYYNQGKLSVIMELLNQKNKIHEDSNSTKLMEFNEQQINKLKLRFPFYLEILLIFYYVKYRKHDLIVDNIMFLDLDSNNNLNSAAIGDEPLIEDDIVKKKKERFKNGLLIKLGNKSVKESNNKNVVYNKKQVKTFEKEYNYIERNELLVNIKLSSVHNLMELKEVVDKLNNERRSNLVKAQSAYKERNKVGKNGIAYYYSNQARDYDKLIPSLCYNCARNIIKGSNYKLDLHGFTINQTTPIIHGALDEWYELESSLIRHNTTTKVQPLQFITGIGIHSKDGKSKIKPHLIKLLSEREWRYQIQFGLILVYGP